MSRQSTLATLIAGSVVLLPGCVANVARPTPAYLDQVKAPEPLAARLDTAMNTMAKRGFSGTVLVAQGTHMVLYKGYGFADQDHKVPATAQTRYPLGAIANQFTAVAVLRLESEGKLAPEADAIQYDPSAAQGIAGENLSQLLTRSGEPVEYANTEGTVAPAAFRGSPRTLALPLEEQFRGEGQSYQELETIVARVTDEEFAQYRQARILDPAKMTRTIEASSATAMDNVAIGRSFASTTPVQAEGLVAPLADLYRWHLALMGSAELNAWGREAMQTPGENGYAPGWVVSKSASGATLLQHVGDTEGFQIWSAWFPANDTVILLAVNSDIGWRNLASQVLLGVLDPAASSVTTTASR
ncbi:MAG: serine hydrolase domain-containing protein [Gemmatimonadales bacterium]